MLEEDKTESSNFTLSIIQSLSGKNQVVAMNTEDGDRGTSSQAFCSYCRSQQAPVSVAGQLRCAECNSVVEPGESSAEPGAPGTEAWRIAHQPPSRKSSDPDHWKSLFDE